MQTETGTNQIVQRSSLSGTFLLSDKSEFADITSYPQLPFDPTPAVELNSTSSNITSPWTIKTDNEIGYDILNFAQSLVNRIKNLEPEYQQIIEKRFWDMI